MRYSKSQIDRAGKVLANYLQAVADDKDEMNAEVMRSTQIVEWWRSDHATPLSRVAASLRYYAAKEGKPVVAQRLKKRPTLAGKLLREPKMKLSRMGDIGGVRAVLPSQDAAYRVASRLRKNWTITKFRDYVAEPKSDGYRALHLINRHRGRLIEIQLRTPHQDRWANFVEVLSRTVAPGLKFGGGPDLLKEYFLLTGEIYAADDQKLPIALDLLARMKELDDQVGTLLRDAANEP
ncbi:MAG TPA: RelA/SpoT domain-containing protein [Solirubrobacterales bacterium]|nr:RelA/SpoT domain-containing protein [Solirubrobacterales bacterium]